MRYYFGAAVSNQGWHIITLDAGQDVTGSITIHNGLSIEATLDDITSIMKFVVPAGVAYLRFICDTRYMEAYVIMKNQVLTQELYREMTGGPSPDDTPVTNLFDPASCEVGWIDGDGVHSPDASFRTSAAIPVEEGDEIYFGAAVSNQGWHIITLDAGQNVTGSITIHNGLSIEATLDDITSIMKFVVPAGGAYLRFICDTRYMEAYVVMKNEVLTEELYREITGVQRPGTSEDFDVDPDSPLLHKRALFCGDSICYGQWDTPVGYGGWAKRIGDAYEMTVDNFSGSGWSISTVGPAVGDGVGRIINLVDRAKGNTYDYVILQGGVNDAYGTDGQPGNWADPGVVSDSFDVADFDVTTYAGALEELFYYSYEYFPDAILGYILTFATPGSTGFGHTDDMEPYYSVGIKVCEKWGVQYLDLYHDDYVTNTLLQTNTNRYLADPLHPNADGYDRLSPYIAQWMETLVDNQIIKENPLYNKTALFCGDSISYGSGDSVGGRAWAGRIGESYHMIVDNQSQSGWSVSTARGARILDQMRMVKDHLYDYVILHGGVNDAWENADPGTVSDSFDVADFDISTYAGALEELFYYAYEYFPSAKIGYILNYATPLATDIGSLADMEPYYSVGIQVCKKWGIQYLDLYHDTYVSDTLLEVSTTKYIADRVHPNAAGYDRLAPYIGAWMETMVHNDDISAVWAVIDQIAALPDAVTPDDAHAVEAARAAYDALGILQKGAVSNLAKLEQAETALQIQPGDVTGDGNVDAADALQVLQHSVGLIALEGNAAKAADVTHDDKIDANDALKILQYSVDLIEEL